LELNTPLFRREWSGVQVGDLLLVSNCGGLGLIGSGSMHPDVLEEHIRKQDLLRITLLG